jgi:hypothetical protein
MALHVEILLRHLLDMQRQWPELATGQKGFTWDDHPTYVSYARVLLRVGLLHRTPELPDVRLALQKARAMHASGLAHQLRVEIICLGDHTGCYGSTWLAGPMRTLREDSVTYLPTRKDREQFEMCVETDSDEDSEDSDDPPPA